MGRFAGLAGIRTNAGGIFYEPGNYLVRLGKIDFKSTRKGDTFIVETEIVESDCATRGPGSKPSYVVVVKREYFETCMGDIKAFAGAVLGIDDVDGYQESITADDRANTPLGQDPLVTATNRFWESVLEELVGPTQPCKGMLIRLNCTMRTTEKGKLFTKHVWGPAVQA
jgi:hypothetical protein